MLAISTRTPCYVWLYERMICTYTACLPRMLCGSHAMRRRYATKEAKWARIALAGTERHTCMAARPSGRQATLGFLR